MSKLIKLMFIFCLGFGCMAKAQTQTQTQTQTQSGDSANSAVIEVPTTSTQIVEEPTNETPELNQLVYIGIGEAQAPKILTAQFNFRPPDRREYLYGIRLVGTRTLVDITQAEVVLRDGRVVPVNRIRGFLREGEMRRVFFGQFGVQIRSIRIWATSPNLLGARGMFRVDMLVNR